MEKLSYAAAYGGERIPAYLFLPKNAKPPYQVVLGFPGANAIYQRSSTNIAELTNLFRFIMRSGRAFLYPIYKSTFERGDGLKSDISDMSAAWRDHMIMWAKDVGRSVDYLESRPDMQRTGSGTWVSAGVQRSRRCFLRSNRGFRSPCSTSAASTGSHRCRKRIR